MYQQKFTPYNKMNQVYQQQQYQQQQSQPLIQQVDASYQPTQKQVKQYAIDVLGMSLPQDQRLLHLARQGLKAPLPTNWQPYQSRDGQVYYKHKITQEKTYQHPTDVQYRKKYQQEKQRMARKNLKSMSLKNNSLGGFGQPLGQSPLGGIGLKQNFNLGISNISSQSHQTLSKQVSKLDPRLQQQLQKQVQQLQFKLKRQLKQFQAERQIQHQKYIKKYKQDFQKGIKQLKTQKSETDYYNAIKSQKQRTKQRLAQAYQQRFKDQANDIQRLQDKKHKQIQQLFQSQNKLKIKKYQQQKEQQFSKKIQSYQNQFKKFKQLQKAKSIQRQDILSQLKNKLQSDDNTQIQQATFKEFQKQIKQLRLNNKQKIKQFETKLQKQYLQMKKLLGQDQNQLLQQSMQKKNRLKKIAEQKIQSIKKKQYQKIAQIYAQQLQKLIKQMKYTIEQRQQRQIQKLKQQQQSNLKLEKKRQSDLIKQKVQKKIEQIYSECERNSKNYQKEKNKKILEIRNKFIQEVIDKNHIKSNQINFKIEINKKQEMIENKQQLVSSLKRQIQLQKVLFQQLNINKQISTASDIDSYLKRLMNNLNITYKPDSFLKQQKIYNELKKKYKKDKQLLGSMMNQLQKTAIYSFYDRQSKNQDHPKNYSSSSILVKQYNKDVRIMRANQQMLVKFQLLLRKAELNDQKSLKQLQTQDFTYEQISIKNSLTQNNSNQQGLKQIQNAEQNYLGKQITSSESYNNYMHVQNTLNAHSKFLSNVKDDLNRKLYKLRSSNYYRV